MKKYFVLFLLFLPIASFGASSVKMLGTKSATPSNVATKVVPVKSTMPSVANNTNVSRAGVLRAKSKSVGSIVSSVSADSRFPAIVPPASKIGSNVNISQPSIGNGVSTGDIIDAVKEDIKGTYYTRDEINAKIDEIDAKIQEIQDAEPKPDPRIDMIKIHNPTNDWKSADVPDGYYFMWIEKE